ncbi:hypothetical protein SUGI_0045740 [Cryptomeria japonica]|uniref:inactive disease susceptibility protein LOV1 n=1 Tax=Cryptomeria japonica TaxID=3369 RepID=UPI002408ED92|nr:inactive disease susceptibility protein LOV1 [Cryptomeria japonica]GLJ06704.1 hypothetical protein SUGI_0045740 [Cryptomeria japonica]
MYKLHDLVLDLAITISKESKCAFSVEEAFKKGTTRVLMVKNSIGNGDVHVMASNRAYSASRLRTSSFSQNKSIQNIPATLLRGARVLRILDLSRTSISSLPACVENLKLLRFLNLSETNITKVPKCVRSNKSLRFLDLSNCSGLERLPNWSGELNCLEHLEHLDIGGFRGFMPKEISKLVSLWVLRTYELGPNIYKLSAEDNEFLKLEHFGNLVNLREVRIDIDHEAELKILDDGILANLVKMRILTIENNVECDNPPPLSEKMIAMKDLEFIYLRNFAMPNWIYVFSNMMKLCLFEIHSAEYPALQMMPNLRSLELLQNKNCKALPGGFWKPGGFPQLCFFHISMFDQLEELSEKEEGAMPRLQRLHVRFCASLNRVPVGLELLKSLKACSFGATEVDHLFKEGGELWNKMKASNPNFIYEEFLSKVLEVGIVKYRINVF